MSTSLLEVRELLKRFHIIVYTGNQADDALVMEAELEDLHEMRLIEDEEYIRARMILKRVMTHAASSILNLSSTIDGPSGKRVL